MKGPYRGSCLCGAVQYEVDAIQPRMAHCHCSMCRKFHGAAFATFGEAFSGDFRWTRGEERLQSYQAPNGTIRRFCRDCGSSMTFTAAGHDEGVVEFALGTLDSDISERPDCHIYQDYRASWYEPDDGLPKFPEGRGS